MVLPVVVSCSGLALVVLVVLVESTDFLGVVVSERLVSVLEFCPFVVVVVVDFCTVNVASEFSVLLPLVDLPVVWSTTTNRFVVVVAG